MSVLDRVAPCVEGSSDRQPSAIAETGVQRLIGRNIRGWSPYFGSYGMGGPGFLELVLDSTDDLPIEHLVLTLWDAGGWVLLNGRWVTAHPAHYVIQRPLFSNYPAQSWDEMSSYLVGSQLVKAEISGDHSSMSIQRGDSFHCLEVPADKSRLPPFGGSGSRRELLGHESILHAWVVTQYTLTVLERAV